MQASGSTTKSAPRRCPRHKSPAVQVPTTTTGLPHHSLPMHEWSYSGYEVSNDLCGNCHNVTNPLLNLKRREWPGHGSVRFRSSAPSRSGNRAPWVTRDRRSSRTARRATCPTRPRIRLVHRVSVGTTGPETCQFINWRGATPGFPQVLKGEYGVGLDRDASFDATTGVGSGPPAEPVGMVSMSLCHRPSVAGWRGARFRMSESPISPATSCRQATARGDGCGCIWSSRDGDRQ